MSEKFESSLLDSGELMKKGCIAIVSNIGRTVAIITVIVAALVVFTDIGFSDFGTERFTSTLFIMLIASYIVYFSLEDAGEKLGEETEEYKRSEKRYTTLVKSISGESIPSLRKFCAEYSAEELKYRRENMLYSYGYTYKEYEDFHRGIIPDDILPRTRRAYLRADLMKAVTLTPKTLLSQERSSRKSELSNPETSKLLRMVISLIPSTVCMTVTVSLMLTAKENMGPAEIIDGLLKLSTLPIIGLRGYAAGYNYSKHTISMWNDTKSRLIEAFLKEEAEKQGK